MTSDLAIAIVLFGLSFVPLAIVIYAGRAALRWIDTKNEIQRSILNNDDRLWRVTLGDDIGDSND